MDPDRFDDLAHALGFAPSRRDLARVLAGAALGALLTALGRPREAAAVCKQDGAKCKKNPNCCSGTCKGKKKKRKCRAAPEARGCTIDDPYATPCPESSNPNQFCWVTLGGKPFCGTGVKCFNCSSNEDCVQEASNPSARCVYTPDGCSAQYNYRSCVVFP
jgi:hypothetical protein